MKKRGQSEVITTVLIILLVLAAVFIVYTAVRNMVAGGTEKASKQSECFGNILTVVSADGSSKQVVITREAGGANADTGNIKVLVDGAAANVTSGDVTIGQLETTTLNLDNTFLANKPVKAAAVLADGTVCPAGGETLSVE